MRRWIAPAAALLLGCVGDVPANDDGGKQTGEEGGPCFSDFACKAGLTCERGPNVCRQPDGSTPADSGPGMDAPSEAPVADASDSGGPCVGMTLAWWTGNDNTKSEIVLGSNVLAWVGTGTYTPGKVGHAFSVSSGGSLQVTPQFMPAAVGAVEMWVDIVSVGTLLHFEGGGNNVFRIDATNVSAGLATLAVTVGTTTITVNNVLAGTFTHIALQMLSSTFDVYVNGTASGSGTGSPAAPSTASLRVGARTNGQNPATATIDELALYKGITAADIGAIYAAGANGYCRLQ